MRIDIQARQFTLTEALRHAVETEARQYEADFADRRRTSLLHHGAALVGPTPPIVGAPPAGADSLDEGVGNSNRNGPPCARMTARSTAFCSSRTFPGQS